MRYLTLTLALVGLSAFAAADLRSEIESMNAKVSKAMMKKDIDAFVKICKPCLTSDFKYVENGKSQTFDEMVEGMKQGMGSLQKVTMVTTKIVSLKQKGNTATCVQKHTMAGTTTGQDKKSHKMSFSGTSTDVFRKEGGKWKMASMTWGQQSMTMDGKKMDMSQMGGG